jgi:hypothetical protein
MSALNLWARSEEVAHYYDSPRPRIQCPSQKGYKCSRSSSQPTHYSLASIPPPPSSTHIEPEMYNSFSTGQVAQLETSPPRGIDEEASKERRACGKSGRCGSPPKSQTGRRSSGWSLARDTGAPQPLPSPEGAPLKTGWYHIRSLGGRGLTVRKVEKDGVYPQPLFVDYVDKRGSGDELGDLLTDGPGVSRFGIILA